MAEEEYQIPIFFINGQLDSGKTRFITETIEMGQFAEAKNKLLIVCEEGEEEYDEKMLKDNGVSMVVLEKEDLTEENLVALEKGVPNLLRHVKNITEVYKLPSVVAINRFPTDTDEEIALIIKKCGELGVNVKLSEVWAKGGKGGIELAEEVVRLCEKDNDFTYSYKTDDTIENKILAVVKNIYGGDGVSFTASAKKQIAELEKLGYGSLPVCIAKTQYSFSDDPTKLGAPSGFTVDVKNVKVSSGAGFIVVYTGEIMTMPGLPKVPAAEKIDVNEKGVIFGLF